MTTQDTAPVPAEPAILPAGSAADGPAAEPSPRRRRGVVAVVGLLLVAGVAGGGAFYLDSADSSTPTAVAAPGTAAATSVASREVAAPVAAYEGLRPDGLVPHTAPLVLSLRDGTFTTVTGTGPDGAPVEGTVGADGRWTSSTPLKPAAAYAMVAQVRDSAGETRSLPLPVSTTPAAKTFGVSLAPGDGASVGVGQAISVRLATPAKDQATKAAVERSLSVTTEPAVQGAWRWMSSSELRYRGPDLWAAGTKITVAAALSHVQVNGVWGPPTRTSTFTVGSANTAVVDVKAHTMTVSQNGQVVRVMKASMGKPGFDTRNGTFVVLEKFADKIMDSATVDLPPGTEPYRTAVKDAVRITNSGTFTHGAPWSVRSQGRSNVSHGCINLSPVDADWYFQQAKRGDVVTVVNSRIGPVLSDAGSQDWNLTFEQWKSGSALV
ncbi:MAG TPA: Ig-like domain-containing protein [Mycobacteriales bacterium]|nr:Ig-like domain-containing protein [Mycobacteriales bacterium]